MALPAFIDFTLARFLLVGVANTAVGLTLIFAAKALLSLDDVAANALGYAVGLCVSFTLNKQWTFGFRGQALAALLRFLLVFGVAYAANLLTVLVLIRHANLGTYLAQAIGIVPYTALFYAGSRWYAFSSPRSA